MVEFLHKHDEYVEVKKPGNPLLTSLKLSEEVGEVHEAVAAVMGSARKIKKIAKDGQTPKERLAEELGDVLIVVKNMCHVFDIPFSTVLNSSVEKMNERMQDERRRV